MIQIYTFTPFFTITFDLSRELFKAETLKTVDRFYYLLVNPLEFYPKILKIHHFIQVLFFENIEFIHAFMITLQYDVFSMNIQ